MQCFGLFLKMLYLSLSQYAVSFVIPYSILVGVMEMTENVKIRYYKMIKKTKVITIITKWVTNELINVLTFADARTECIRYNHDEVCVGYHLDGEWSLTSICVTAVT